MILYRLGTSRSVLGLDESESDLFMSINDSKGRYDPNLEVKTSIYDLIVIFIQKL